MIDKPKQIILLRRDLRNKDLQRVRTGKLAAQVAHASMAWLTRRLECESMAFDPRIPARYSLALSHEEADWAVNGLTKVVLGVDSEVELRTLLNEADAAGLTTTLIEDLGRTEFAGPTVTCGAIGPHFPDKIDAITRHLRPY